ncbi:MAG TPA: hypothetical protein VGH98_01305 [Gemmatimonadaceae bacterium]|jgi:hypothetical protein
MSHLPDERLSALTDDPPTSAELAHLASCERCAAERAAYRALREVARSEQSRIGAPLSDWESLAPALRADGVIDTGEWRVARRPRRFGGVWSQAAAAVLIAIGGIAYGRYSAAGSMLPALRHGGGALAKAGADSSAFSSLEEARSAQEQAQTLYQSAALYLAAHDTLELSPDSPAAMRHRLATLDEVGATVRQALAESPGDPVINGYYLTTLGQRDATLRQLNASLPANMRVNIF